MVSAHVVISDVCRTYTPFDQEFVDELKRQIPSAHRRWEPEDRCWRVHLAYEEIVIRLCKWAFDDVHVSRHPQGQRRSPNTQTRAVSTDHAVLYVLPNAPRPVVDAAYRALARMLHPDASTAPDATEKMQQLNNAYERIRALS